MATVAQILDRACRITGLRTTGTERELALAALQDAYSRAAMDAECNLTTATHTFLTSQDSYLLSDLLNEQPVRLYHVSMTTDSYAIPLQQVSLNELLDVRERDIGAGTPYMYAMNGFRGIELHPNPAVGSTIRFVYLDAVPTLAEIAGNASEEETPSCIPSQFHWAVLLPATVLEMLDKDQRLAEAGIWNERYERGIARLQEHIGQMGGDANRAYIEKGGRRLRHNDQRSRW